MGNEGRGPWFLEIFQDHVSKTYHIRKVGEGGVSLDRKKKVRPTVCQSGPATPLLTPHSRLRIPLELLDAIVDYTSLLGKEKARERRGQLVHRLSGFNEATQQTFTYLRQSVATPMPE